MADQPTPLASSNDEAAAGAGMAVTSREAWTVVHGMGLGALFLLAYSGGWVALSNLRRERLSEEVLHQEMRPLKRWFWGMALVFWCTVLTGTFRGYPVYRGTPPPGVPPLTPSPRSVLLDNPRTARWHSFGMEWKEHVAWLVPMTSTAVAASISSFGPDLADRPRERKTLLAWFHLSFLMAAVAALFGAFINKLAPIRETSHAEEA
jgi:hypothetical protein